MSTQTSLHTAMGPLTLPGVVGRHIEVEDLERDVRLSSDDMESPRVFSVAGGTAAAFAQRSPTKITPNEDVAALVALGPHRGVLVIADGLGGHAAGEEASQLAIKQLTKELLSAEDDSDLRPVILNGIEAANIAVRELGNGSATTLAIAEINDRVVRTYHVGDSAVLLAGGRGRVKFLTIAHSPVGYAVESGMIDEAAAMHHEDRHMISNVIGESDMRIEIGPPVKMAPRDTLLLASDGLFDNLLPEEIVEHARRGPVGTAVSRLAEQAIFRMTDAHTETPSKPDDLSIITFRLT